MISVHRSERALRDEPGRTHLRWVTLTLLAVVIAFVDGFWTTSLRGAVGAIEETQEPFEAWVRSSELTLPFYVLAVVVAAVIARRWVGTGRRNLVKPLAVALLVVVTTTLVGVGAMAVNAVNDYHLQSERLAVVHARHVGTDRRRFGARSRRTCRSCGRRGLQRAVPSATLDARRARARRGLRRGRAAPHQPPAGRLPRRAVGHSPVGAPRPDRARRWRGKRAVGGRVAPQARFSGASPGYSSSVT